MSSVATKRMAKTAVATSTSARVNPRCRTIDRSCFRILVSVCISVRARRVENQLAPSVLFVPLDENAHLKYLRRTELRRGDIGGVFLRNHNDRDRSIRERSTELRLPFREHVRGVGAGRH